MLSTEDAKAVSALAVDVSELLTRIGLPQGAAKPLTVAYHAACSLQHGQQIKTCLLYTSRCV